MAKNLVKTYNNIARGYNREAKYREAIKATQEEEDRGQGAGTQGRKAKRDRKDRGGPEERQDGEERDQEAEQGGHHGQHAGDHDRKEDKGQEQKRGRGRGGEGGRNE